MIKTIVTYGATHVRFPRIWVEKIVRATLSQAKVRKGCVSVRFVDNKEVVALQKKYRDKNIPTDVLAFSSKEGKLLDFFREPRKAEGGSDLGDVVISCEYVRGRVKRQPPLKFRGEIAMLIIHGVLHLTGFDHKKKKEAKKMWELQSKVSSKVGASFIEFEQFG